MVPSLTEHCRISELRTGKKYEDLHRWMDEHHKNLGVQHRQERHSTNYIEEVRQRWSNEGVLEYLIHIIIDYKETTNKLLKILKEIKIEKQDLINDYNMLLEEAETLEHAALVEVPSYLSSKFKKK